MDHREFERNYKDRVFKVHRPNICYCVKCELKRRRKKKPMCEKQSTSSRFGALIAVIFVIFAVLFMIGQINDAKKTLKDAEDEGNRIRYRR